MLTKPVRWAFRAFLSSENTFFPSTSQLGTTAAGVLVHTHIQHEPCHIFILVSLTNEVTIKVTLDSGFLLLPYTSNNWFQGSQTRNTENTQRIL